MGKICDFRPKSPFIAETVRDRPIVIMEVKADRSVSVSMTSSDLECGREGSFFSDGSPIVCMTKNDKIWYGNTGEKKHVSRYVWNL